MPVENTYRRQYGIIGKSSGMEAVYELIGKLAPKLTLVHIEGESGTGKELIARALHNNSPRRSGLFIGLNCTAVAESVLESELFGYEKGAFTGAQATKKGLLEIAQDGTLFLDEIAKIGKPMQEKLLRPLDGNEFYRVGGTTPRTTNARIITASSSSLEYALSSGSMSEEFYYRVLGLTIRVPKLSERGEDIGMLATYFLEQQYARLGISVTVNDAAKKYLMSLPWRGNVRELRRFMEAAYGLKDTPTEADNPVVFTEKDFKDLYEKYWIGTKNIPQPSTSVSKPGIIMIDLSNIAPGQVMEEVEKQAIVKALELTKGNKEKAAELLGIPRKTLYSRLKELGY